MSPRFSIYVLLIAVPGIFPNVRAEGIEPNKIAPPATAPDPRPAMILERGVPIKAADACADPELLPNWMPPTWNTQAGSEQCGVLETDNLAVLQPMGQGVAQWTIATTAKYGLTPRLEVRWGLPGRIYQQGGRTKSLTGTTDQWFGALYHFHDQGGWIPDFALDYAIKVPTANAAKGFGSGYTDHAITFIASRDYGPNHVDFNMVGTIAGSESGEDGAAQFGMGLTRTFSRRLLATVEAYGGPQPGTSDRYGAVFLGGSWGLNPRLAINGGCVHSYTAADPRSQYMFGFTYTTRIGITAPRNARWSRILGR